MTANINPDSGIAYGYISANALDSDLVDELQMDGTDVYYEEAKEEAQREAAREWCTNIIATNVLDLPLLCPSDPGSNAQFNAGPQPLDEDTLFEVVLKYVKETWSGSKWEDSFNDSYQPDEPVHEGEKDGVKYRTSWLGGALNVWVFESPHVTDKARRASPCVPNAGILDTLDGDVRAYNVPDEWRRKED